jgi:bacteriorhodopsin
MWIATPFATVFVGFLIVSGISAAGLAWSAHEGSWHRAAQVTLAAFAMAALWWAAVTIRVPFAWSYFGFTAGSLIGTAGIPGGAAALWARRRSDDEPKRNWLGVLAIAGVVWLPLALVFALGAACNLEAACY